MGSNVSSDLGGRRSGGPDERAKERTASPARGKISLSAINGWRGPGALAIAFAHFAIITDFFRYRTVEPIALIVDLFFVFSGVVIAHTYAEKLKQPSAIPEYMIRRFGRIWPVQAATLAALVAYELLKLVLATHFGKQTTSPPFSMNGPNFLSAIPTNLLLVHSLGIHDKETWNFPSWSLSVEFFTYLAFAGYCLMRPVPKTVVSLATIFISIAILIFVAPFHMRSTFDFGLFRCLAGFLAGTLCYEAMTRWSLPKWPFPTLVEIATVVLVGLWLAAASGDYAAFAAPFVFSMFVAVFVAERGALSRLLAKKPFQFFAELSFTIYMVHAIVLLFGLAAMHMLARAGVVSNFIEVPNPLAINPDARATVEVFPVSNPVIFLVMGSIYGAVVIGAAFLLYRYIEVPGRAFFGRLAKATRSKASEPNDPAARRITRTPSDQLAN